MRSPIGRAGNGAAVLFLLGASLAVPQILAAAGPAAAAAHVAVSPSATPAFIPNAGCGTGNPAYNYEGSGDAADPQVVYSAGTYYAFTTGNALGNHIAALVSSSPNSGYGPYTHGCYGSTALPNPSPWEQANTQTSPGVFQYGGHWVMFYDAAQSGHDVGQRVRLPRRGDGGLHLPHGRHSSATCRTAPSNASPPGPSTPSRTSTPARASPTSCGSRTTVARPRRRTSGPSSSTRPGPASPPVRRRASCSRTTPCRIPGRPPSRTRRWRRRAAASTWRSRPASTRAPATPEGITACSGPLGPCGPQSQVLTTYGSVLGPGGGSLFSDAAGNWWLDYAAWQGGSPGCTSYACGAARQLFVAADQPAQRHRAGSLQRAGVAVRVRHGRLGRRDLRLRQSPVLRLGGGRLAEQARGGDGADP